MPYSHRVPGIWSGRRVRARRSCRSASTVSSTRISKRSMVSDTARLPSAGRCELQLECVEPAQHVDRRVVVLACTVGTVHGFVDPDVIHAVEDPFETHPTLGARERRARARVDAEPEADVLAAVGAVGAHVGRALEVTRVAVGGTFDHHDGRTGWDVDVADLRVATRQSEVALDRALDAHDLFDE